MCCHHHAWQLETMKGMENNDHFTLVRTQLITTMKQFFFFGCCINVCIPWMSQANTSRSFYTEQTGRMIAHCQVTPPWSRLNPWEDQLDVHQQQLWLFGQGGWHLGWQAEKPAKEWAKLWRKKCNGSASKSTMCIPTKRRIISTNHWHWSWCWAKMLSLLNLLDPLSAKKRCNCHTFY